MKIKQSERKTLFVVREGLDLTCFCQDDADW